MPSPSRKLARKAPGGNTTKAPAASSPASGDRPAAAASGQGGGMVQFDSSKRTLQMVSRRISPEQVESILELALQGDPTYQAELFELMQDTWPRLVKNLNEVKRAVASLPWQVQPYCEAEGGEPDAEAIARAELVEKALLGMKADPARWEADFEDTLYHLLDAQGSGISVLELYWNEQGFDRPHFPAPGIIGPRSSKFIPGRYYGFPCVTGMEDRLMLNPAGNGNRSGLVDFPPDKFLIGVCASRSGHPMNTALLRSLAKYWVGAQFGFQWLCNYAQMFGAPIRWATYDPNNKRLLDDIVAMLENIGTAGWGAFPLGTTLELKEPTKAAQDNPQVFLQEAADRACDILILGQTLTTDVGSSGSRALGDTHKSIRGDVLKGAAGWVGRTISSQLIPAILRMNYGSAEKAPTLLLEIEEKGDELLKAQRDKILFVDMGLPVAKEFLYERHGVPMPSEEDDLFGPEKPEDPAAGQGGEADPEKADPAAEMDARGGPRLHSAALIEARKIALMDKLTTNVMESLSGVSAQWLGPARPVFRELLAKAMDESVSDADLIKACEAARAKMPELFDSLNKDALAGALEAAMGASAANGAITASLERKTKRSAKT